MILQKIMVHYYIYHKTNELIQFISMGNMVKSRRDKCSLDRQFRLTLGLISTAISWDTRNSFDDTSKVQRN